MRKITIFGMLLLFAVFASAFAFAGTSGPSPIPPPPNFQLSTNVLSLCKGMINTVPISIKTPVGASLMQDVQLSITNSRYAYTVGNGTISAVNVSANKTNTVNMKIFTSLNSSSLISVGVAINYQYDTLYSDSEVRNISFGVESCPSTLSIGVHPGVLTSGKIENITFNLTNTGNTTLNYLSMHAALPSIDGTFLGQQPIQVSSIAPHSTAKVNEDVFVYSNATQSFPINLTVSLYNGTSLEQINQNPIVLSTGIINITPSSLTVSPSVPTPGSIFSMSFVLTDVGTSKAAAVTATALVPKGFAPYGSNSVFVGDMQVDSQTPVTLTLTAQSTLKSGNYTIPVRINYLNTLRENLSTIINVPVQIASVSTYNSIRGAINGTTTTYSHSRGGNALIIVILLIIAVVVLLVLFLKERKHRKLHSK
ncbi:MAG: hypothetical protein ABR981_02200 [Candidatus Micrarchaeaceae archaeon]|jgi:hypothetical protein